MKVIWTFVSGLRLFGIDLPKFFKSLWSVPAFVRDLFVFSRQRRRFGDPIPLGKLYPCLDDRWADSGSAKGHYFHQDLVVARRVFENSPEVHVDVGSRVDGFVAHLAVFRKVTVIDVRPLATSASNIEFVRADVMAALPAGLIESCDSLSCLHALEHFGLGRYGDPVRHDGHVVGLRNLTSILKPGGRFYLSVPIGPNRIEFNGQRVFSVSYLLQLLANDFAIDRFSYVDDEGELHGGVPLEAHRVDADFDCWYGCGVFELRKKPAAQDRSRNLALQPEGVAC